MYKFIDKHGYGKPYTYVHPYKQQAVKQFVNILPEWVEMVILFGSAVQTYCKPTSDIDVCIIGTPPNKGNYDIDIHEQTIDFLQYNTKENFLAAVENNPYGAAAEAYLKGVVVYAKQNRLSKTS